jgi:riboflavin kinase/FMN adenylyltransferase
MIIFDSIDQINKFDLPRTSVALGNFDGVHVGHAELIERSTSYAKAHGLSSAVFTFSNHPRNVLSGKHVLRSICDPVSKAKLIESLGVDFLFSLPFDEHFHEMSPDCFIQDLVLKTFRAEHVSCGFNFRFGSGASGGVGLLKKESKAFGFDLDVLEPVRIDGVLVSSTAVRHAITAGDVELAAKYLGRNYEINGEVIHGHQNGRKMGFPTANVALGDELIYPPHGVYATLTSVDVVTPGTFPEGVCPHLSGLPSVTNIGIRPTIGDKLYLSETHILSGDYDLYGKNIRTEFIKMIRSEAKYADLTALSTQISIDKDNASKILAEYGLK